MENSKKKVESKGKMIHLGRDSKSGHFYKKTSKALMPTITPDRKIKK